MSANTLLKQVWAFTLAKEAAPELASGKLLMRANSTSLVKRTSQILAAEAEVDEDSARGAYIPKVKHEKMSGIVVIAHVVTNPGQNPVQTRPVRLFDDGDGGLSTKGKHFASETIAKRAINHMKDLAKNDKPGGILMYARGTTKHCREAKGMFV